MPKTKIKYCFVDDCHNTSELNKNKLFLSVPINTEIRSKWYEAANKNGYHSKCRSLLCCEDHFDLPNDAENWIYFKMLGSKIHLKKDVVPHIFPRRRPRSEHFTSQFTEKEKEIKRILIEKLDKDKESENINTTTYDLCSNSNDSAKSLNMDSNIDEDYIPSYYLDNSTKNESENNSSTTNNSEQTEIILSMPCDCQRKCSSILKCNHQTGKRKQLNLRKKHKVNSSSDEISNDSNSAGSNVNGPSQTNLCTDPEFLTIKTESIDIDECEMKDNFDYLDRSKYQFEQVLLSENEEMSSSTEIEIKMEPFQEDEDFESKTSLTEFEPEIEIKTEPNQEMEHTEEKNIEIENDKLTKKTCFVDSCPNNSETNKNKEFLKVPLSGPTRLKWYKSVNKSEEPTEDEVFCCEDMTNDTENNAFHELFGSKLKKNVVPHLFSKQESQEFQITKICSANEIISVSNSNSMDFHFVDIKDEEKKEDNEIYEFGNFKSEEIDIEESKIEYNQGKHFLLDSDIQNKPKNEDMLQVPENVKPQNKVTKYCFISNCFNNSVENENKLFLTVPFKLEIRRKWFQAVNRKEAFCRTKNLHCCEDHFDLANDAKNWIYFKMFGKKLTIKEHVVPHIFPTVRHSRSQLSEQEKELKRKFVEDYELRAHEEIKPKKPKNVLPTDSDDEDEFEDSALDKKKKIVIVPLKGQNDEMQLMEFDKDMQKKFLEDFDKSVVEGKKAYIPISSIPKNTTSVTASDKKNIPVKKKRKAKLKVLVDPNEEQINNLDETFEVESNNEVIVPVKNKKRKFKSLLKPAKNQIENGVSTTNPEENETIISSQLNIHIEPDLPELIFIRDKVEKHKPLLLRRKSKVKTVQEVVWINPPLVEVSNEIIDLDEDSNENLENNQIKTSTQEIEIKREAQSEDFEFVNVNAKYNSSFFSEDPQKVSGKNIFVVNQIEESILS